ncbi:extracellular solute-binding protein [Ruania alkalisoli]|uniref:Extracellular solute-binding protein n=1 Tax=Ruania alkalisoli TaxID=2779775 RepID=A0A7M1SRF6_9MICO|nr:extracellular solute-binding protein [Ruania alkalisoli]QOR70065.1 extracellular solute-binding protein [Ruania alkalisoli]
MITSNQRLSRRGLLGGALGLTAGVGALSACGPGDGGGSGDEPPEDMGSAEEGRLVVWGGLPPEMGPQALVDAFTAKYPDIEVEYVRFVNNAEGILKLDTALQGGVPIDVFFSYGTVDVVRRAQAGLALDLTDLAREDDLAQVFVQDEPISTLIDGKLYSIPTTHWPQFVVLNQDAMESAGIEIPFDWTVEDYHRVAREFKSAGFDVGAYHPPRMASTSLGGDYIYKNGGQESNLDDPLFKQELELILAMEDDGSIFTQERITAEQLGGYVQNYFVDGTFPMYIDGTTALRFLKNLDEYPHDFRTTFRPYPAPTAGADYFNPGVRGDDVQISSKSQYPSAAWTFVKFWIDEGANHMSPAGKVSPYQFDNPTDEMMDALFGPERDRLFNVDDFHETFFVPEPPLSVRSITTAYTEIASLKSQIEDEIRLRTKSVDDGIAEMKQEADAAIADWLG